ATFDTPGVINQLENLPHLLSSEKVERLSHGADYVVKLPFYISENDERPVTIKVFKRQSKFKDWYDRRNKSKAERSYRAAIFLQNKNIGTPAPIAWLDRWDGDLL